MAIDWDAIYKQKWKELATDYTAREAKLNAAKNAETAQLKSILNSEKASAADLRDEALRQAYISQMTSYRDLPETLSRSGLNGGITESMAADILRTYQNARNSANSDYSAASLNLDGDYKKNKTDLDSRYLTLFNELYDKRNKDVWDQTKFAYDAALNEQKRLLEEAKQQELIRQFNEEMAFKREQAAQKSSGSARSGSRSGSKKKSSSSKKTTAAVSGYKFVPSLKTPKTDKVLPSLGFTKR